MKPKSRSPILSAKGMGLIIAVLLILATLCVVYHHQTTPTTDPALSLQEVMQLRNPDLVVDEVEEIALDLE